jgi:predicted nuclease of predicted toxin-antitoxin system
MKFIVDQPVSPRIADWLQTSEAGGHDAVHVRDRGMSNAADEMIFALAVQEQRVVITADLDFARLQSLSGKDGPGLILFRAGNISDLQMLELTARVLREVRLDELSRSIVVIDLDSIRIARLPVLRGL